MKWNVGDKVEIYKGHGDGIDRRLQYTPQICEIVQAKHGHYEVDGPLAGIAVTDAMIKGLAVVRGDRVKAWDEKEETAASFIYVSTIKGLMYPIGVVSKGDEQFFREGKPFALSVFKHMAPIPPEPEPSEADIVARLMIKIERLEIGLGNIATSQPWCQAVKELQKVAKDVLEGKS